MNPNLICSISWDAAWISVLLGRRWCFHAASLWTSETVPIQWTAPLLNGLCVQLWQSDSCLLYSFIVWQPWTFFLRAMTPAVWCDQSRWPRETTRDTEREEEGNICSAGQDLSADHRSAWTEPGVMTSVVLTVHRLKLKCVIFQCYFLSQLNVERHWHTDH